MIDSENELTQEETTEVEAIDYTEALENIVNVFQSYATPISSLVEISSYNNTLLEQINSKPDYGFTIAYTTFVLCLFEVLRFVKGKLGGKKDE